MLPGCYSDKLEEVVCYHTLTEKVIASLHKKSFHLIEFLAARIFESVEQHLQPLVLLPVNSCHSGCVKAPGLRLSKRGGISKQYTPPLRQLNHGSFHASPSGRNLREEALDAVIEVTVTKPNHPVPHIHKGVVFKYCRRVSQKSL